MRAHLLPAYTPELNPVESIRGYAKMNLLANFGPVKADDRFRYTQRAPLTLAANPSWLRSFISHCPRA